MGGSASSVGGGAVGGVVGNSVMGPIGAVTGAKLGSKAGLGGIGDMLSGTSKDAGILGIGQFKGDVYDPNAKAFEDPSSKKRQQDFARQLAESQKRQAQQVQAAQINMSPQEQFRAQQLQLSQQLQAQAAGQGPSLAQSQLRQATDRNIQQAMALAATQRGNPALAQRQLLQTTAQANQMAGQQAADLRMQEQMAARQQLAGVTQAGRGQDIGLATDQAKFLQDAALANQQAAIQQQNLNDQMARYYNTGIMSQAEADRKAQMDLEALRAQQSLGVQGVNQQAYANASQARGNLVGGIGSAVAMMSDENEKKDIKDGEKSTSDFFKAMMASMKTPDGGSSNPYQGQQKMGSAIGTGLMSMFKDKAPSPSTGAPMALAPMGLPAMGPAPAPSDRELKKDVRSGLGDIKDFLGSLKAYEYKYKDPKNGAGTYVSPMAQDIEKTALGKDMVIDTPEGKMVDYGRAGGVMLASAAMLNDRVEEMEKKLAKAFAKKKGA